MIDPSRLYSEEEIRLMYEDEGRPPIEGTYIYKIAGECDAGYRCHLAECNDQRIVKILTRIPLTQEDACKLVIKEYPHLRVVQPRADWPKPSQYNNIEDAMQRSIDQIEQLTCSWSETDRQKIPCEYLYWSNDGVIGGKVIADGEGNFRYFDGESKNTTWPVGKMKFKPPRKIAAPSKLEISQKAKFLARMLENDHLVNNHDFWNNVYGSMIDLEVERYDKLKEKGVVVSLN